MGTNYYWRENPCSECGRGDEIHIGKSIAGWEFSFHGTDEIQSWKDWYERLATGGKIFDEYESEIGLNDFRKVVDDRSHPRGLQNHTDYCAKYHPFCYETLWKDDEGYSFNPGEFS